MNLPAVFKHNIQHAFKEEGIAWLDELPAILDHIIDYWQLSHIHAYPNLTYNYVASAFSKKYNRDVVIKLSVPSQQFHYECDTLKFYDGRGSVLLLDVHETKSAMLLEKLQAGYSLKSLFPGNEDEHIQICVDIMRQLHQKSPENHDVDSFRHIYDGLDYLKQCKNQKFSSDIMQHTIKLYKALLDSQQNRCLLHGDLHQDNILFDEKRGWLAIDPKGYIGEGAYDVASFIRNPDDLIKLPNAAAIIQYRLDHFSELLNIDRQRLVDWSYVHTVKAACWALDDNSPAVSSMLSVYDILKQEKPSTF